MIPEAITIKGTKHGLMILLDPELDFEQLKSGLTQKIRSARDFFRGANFCLQPGIRVLSATQQSELENICIEHGLVPDAQIVSPKRHKAERMAGLKGIFPSEEQENCLLVEQSLRSGQRIEYNGHVTVMGDVKPGAEVVAAGNIMVMGSLQGVAHAGATGNETALILAYDLRPTQLRIAGLIALAPEEKAGRSAGGPMLAHMFRGTILVEPYVSRNDHSSREWTSLAN